MVLITTYHDVERAVVDQISELIDKIRSTRIEKHTSDEVRVTSVLKSQCAIDELQDRIKAIYQSH